MDQKQADEIRQNVRDSYAKVAEASNESESCGPNQAAAVFLLMTLSIH